MYDDGILQSNNIIEYKIYRLQTPALSEYRKLRRSQCLDYHIAEINSSTNYYPFGFAMPGRDITSEKSRFGFNGKEKDQDGEFGDLSHDDYGFGIYNPAIGRFLSVDPFARSYPELTPYQFASNTPIQAIDIDGLEAYYIHQYWGTDKNERPALTVPVFDENALNIDGVFVVNHYPSTQTQVAYNSEPRQALYSDYKNYFPNFAKGIYNRPDREDGRSKYTFDIGLKVTYGSVGWDIRAFGAKSAIYGGAEGDILNIRYDTDESGSVTGPNTDILRVGGYFGQAIGGGYTRDFDVSTGKFMNSGRAKIDLGAFGLEANRYSKEASGKVGLTAKVALGLGLEFETNLRNNEQKNVNFTKFEKTKINALHKKSSSSEKVVHP